MSTPKDRGRKIASPPETMPIAVSLARAGWPVFPVSIYEDADGKRHKIPAVKWKEWATTDPKAVAKAWAGEHSGRWIGVHAGKAGIVVLDVDPPKPKIDKATGEKVGMTLSGAASLAAASLDIPPTFDYPTHRKGGRHFVYAAPEGVELTIGADILGPDGAKLEGVDVRAGHGLMIYYGPELKSAPTLAPAPDWLLVERGRPQANGGVDRAPSADEDAYRERLTEGKAPREIRDLTRAVDFPPGAAHDAMLEVVAALISEGRRGTRGIAPLLDETRERYVGTHPDRGRDWDNAVAGSIKRLGLPPATIPLTKQERKAIAQRNDPKAIKQAAREHVAKKIEKRTAPADDDLSDDALADRFAELIRDAWAHVPGVGLLRYDGLVWKPVDEALLVERARLWLRDIRREATVVAIRRGDKTLEAEAKRLGQKGTISAVARLTSGILLDHAPTLDRDPDLLNVQNGVVDLRTSTLRERRPDDFFTKVAAVEYHPGERSADWEQALKAVPRTVADWLKVRLGQATTGRISTDKSVPFLVGGGDNGKSAVLGACRGALGDYAVTVPERLLLGSDSDHPTEIMTLQGARMAIFEELPRGGRLNAQRMKLLAGTNVLTGRRMNQDFSSFPATHTLLGSSNHLPVISDVDDAIWGRVAPVVFPYKFVSGEPMKKTNQRRGDPGLRDRLAEAPQAAVLTWLIEGAAASYRGMPPKPDRVQAALDEWRGDSDPVLGFVRDRLVIDPKSVIAASDLYSEFGRYLEGRGQTRWSDNLMAVSFSGHSSLEGVRKRQLKLGPRTVLSRPAFTTKGVPPRAMSWVGVRFIDDPMTKSEAERDAEIIADLERRAS